MRITHVISELVPGGGERVAIELANASKEFGDDVSIVVRRSVPNSPMYAHLHSDIPVHAVCSGSPTRIGWLPETLAFVWRNPVIWTADVVHVHLTYGALVGLLIRYLSKLRGRGPVVLETYHSVGMTMPRWRRAARAWIASRFHAIALMAMDPYWEKFARQHTHLPVELIPNGVHVPITAAVTLEERAAFRESLGIPASCKQIVGTIGMLRPERHPERIIEVFAELATRTSPHVHFIMFGDGVERERVRSRIEALGLGERIHLPGVAVDSRLPIAIMDTYLTLNVGAITGMAALEAIFLGAPVVGLQLNADYETSSEDWIWSHTEPANVAEFLHAMLTNPGIGHDWKDRQQRHAKLNFTTSAMMEKYRALYRRAIEHFDPQPGLS
jgi:glycosyltransferase involved in cell wall biosynthesis